MARCLAIDFRDSDNQACDVGSSECKSERLRPSCREQFRLCFAKVIEVRCLGAYILSRGRVIHAYLAWLLSERSLLHATFVAQNVLYDLDSEEDGSLHASHRSVR